LIINALALIINRPPWRRGQGGLTDRTYPKAFNISHRIFTKIRLSVALYPK